MLALSRKVMFHGIELIHVKNIRLMDGMPLSRLMPKVSWVTGGWAVVVVVVYDINMLLYPRVVSWLLLSVGFG
jgi:hypothetical protein